MNKFYFRGWLKGPKKRCSDVLIIESMYDKPLINAFLESEQRKLDKEGDSFILGYDNELLERIDKSLKELLKYNGKDKELWTKAVKENLPALFEYDNNFDVLSERFSIELWELIEFMEEAKKCEILYPKKDFETVEHFLDKAIYFKNKYNKE